MGHSDSFRPVYMTVFALLVLLSLYLNLVLENTREAIREKGVVFDLAPPNHRALDSYCELPLFNRQIGARMLKSASVRRG